MQLPDVSRLGRPGPARSWFDNTQLTQLSQLPYTQTPGRSPARANYVPLPMAPIDGTKGEEKLIIYLHKKLEKFTNLTPGIV